MLRRGQKNGKEAGSLGLGSRSNCHWPLAHCSFRAIRETWDSQGMIVSVVKALSKLWLIDRLGSACQIDQFCTVHTSSLFACVVASSAKMEPSSQAQKHLQSPNNPKKDESYVSHVHIKRRSFPSLAMTATVL
jgi:hypothetical protein